MKSKPTKELLDSLARSDTIESYIQNQEDYLLDCTVSQYLNQLLEEKALSKSAVIKKAEINEIYAFQIFSGKRNPSRDKLISLCVGMELSLDETQQVLKVAGFAPLYAKSKRDSVIAYGILQKMGILAINELLYNQSESTL